MLTRQIRRLVQVCLLAAFASVVFVGPAVHAQSDAKEKHARYKRLLKKPFMEQIKWETELKKAIKGAKSKKLPILAYFTRSDREWPPSEQCEGEFMMSQWWIEASERFVPYISVNTGGLNLPEESRAKKLLESGGQRTLVLPIFLVLDHRGEELARFRMNSQNDLEANLGEAEELLEARHAVKENRGDKVAKARLTLLEEMRREKPDLKAMAKAARTKGLDEDILARYQSFAVEIPVRDLLEEFQHARGKESAAGAEAQARIRTTYDVKMYKLYRKRTVIKDVGSDYHYKYWLMVFRGAAEKKDRGSATDAFQVFEKVYGSKNKYKKDVIKMKEILKGL